MSNDYYLNNPLIHQDRRLAMNASKWIRSFDCADMRPLIICRGPIRKEAMDVFDEMGIENYGILLSEKDSIIYQNALAPELRKLTDPSRVHRMTDYTGSTKEERAERIRQIIKIAYDNNYNSIFAGYGFMSEDAEMVVAMETAGLNFIGPCSYTQNSAGMKDQAKRTALQTGVSVTPGINNATSLALFAKYGMNGMQQCAEDNNLAVDFESLKDEEEQALALLAASYKAGIDIIGAEDIGAALQVEATRMLTEKPSNRFRLKAIAGGGGKGQRILSSANSYEGVSLDEKVRKAVQRVPELVLECLIELKTNGVGDNKNVLIEMNIDTTRHQEIQVIGNGEWCVTMGGRDCSLQMHEQKLLEVSVTEEELVGAISAAEATGNLRESHELKKDLDILQKMEQEGAAFGKAVKLDSLGTFECIVDGEAHYFMEMNTRVQVEHRVTELCYALKFTNPENHEESFLVNSLVETMVLLAAHGPNLPEPTRVARSISTVEARLNATNNALVPHAGGVIEYWSNPQQFEIRDDQGISLHNPDTDTFMKYHLAGAYDSNIALILTEGANRLNSYERLSEVIRRTTIQGKDLATNLDFHYGLVNWFIGQNINARPTTRFIVPYLTAVGLFRQQAINIDLDNAYEKIKSKILKGFDQKTQKAAASTIDHKQGLLLRPIKRLLDEPHILAGWLSINRDCYTLIETRICWNENPIKLLANTYHFLNMDYREGDIAANMIWDHDNDLLQSAIAFYETLSNRLSTENWLELQLLLESENCPVGIDYEDWSAVRGAHQGYQHGMEILAVLPYLGEDSGFYQLTVNNDLTIQIPERLLDEDLQNKMSKVLVPPPTSNSDEILAISGGMYYSREAPGMNIFIEEGEHFEEGDALYIVEVMKMFNKVFAPFSGTLDQILIDGDGVIISKGQPLFKITPDSITVQDSLEDINKCIQVETNRFLEKVI